MSDLKGFAGFGVKNGWGDISTPMYAGDRIDGEKCNLRVVSLDNSENQVVRLDVG